MTKRQGQTERRDSVARERVLERFRLEFRTHPGLALTDLQAARLCGLPAEVSTRLLVRLVEQGEMFIRADGRFVLREAR